MVEEYQQDEYEDCFDQDMDIICIPPWGIISSEASLAHAGSIVHHQSCDFIVTHLADGSCTIPVLNDLSTDSLKVFKGDIVSALIAFHIFEWRVNI